ncbi:hypothetical protein OOK31_38495 [Streptomyces sp. NBC_00249]|uniref:hypothetical protein n=1 Tax=Streptomyces sp. NBC_00249 TaxID=2975690 RepID=UPI00224EAB29|nr:hypothetical protein [Streptomyces sp. NBC_00249]MCX5199702.1 hypothetical protein [Streptomyces sp. NBC_00249]
MALGVGGAVAAVSAAFWGGLLVGLDAQGAVRDSAAVALWASLALAAGLWIGIPYVRWSAAREAARIRAGAPR